MPKQMTKKADEGGGSKTADELAAEERERAAAAASDGDHALTTHRAPARTFRDTGLSSAQFPMLTRSNYTNWSLLMQARDLWTAVELGTPEYGDDRAAMEANLGAVPPELISTLAR
jgi:hypothetical protein